MTRTHTTALLSLALSFALLLSTPAAAQTQPTPPRTGPTARHDDDRQIMAQLRAELAALKLTVEQMKNQREQLIAFLEDERDDNVAERLAEWQAEREKLAEERRLLRAERLRLEAARKALHETTMRQARQDAQRQARDRTRDEGGEQAGKQARDNDETTRRSAPDWSGQAMVGLIDREGGETPAIVYVAPGRVVVTAESYPRIDPKNVMVRGNLLNKSLDSWRYTFEIRLYGSAGLGPPKLQGSWRYQTPLLGPGDLHQFEVQVPVDNARLIDAVQFVKVTGDKPPAPQPDSPASTD